MPFTLSHPAAVLPLRNKLPLAALLAGSVSPDLGYYFGVTEYFRMNAHTFPRSFSFCLPAGTCLLLLIFFLRAGIEKLLPESLATLFASLFAKPLFSFRSLPCTLLAILIGAYTHILWDSFTHRTGFFVDFTPMLQIKIIAGIELYRLFQHFSTLLGGIVIYIFVHNQCLRLCSPIIYAFSWRWIFWLLLGFIAVFFTALTLTHPWNYALASNDHRLWFLFVVSFVRNGFVLVMLAASFAILAGCVEKPRLNS